MSKSPSLRRIQADIRELALDPSDRYHASPLENDMFEWHFTIRGADGTDFEGGVYHGRIMLPPEYPFKPPHIIFLTPSGRFETNTKVCLSFSAFHPELWQPAWGIRLILEALISFLPTPADGAIGALDWTSAERKKLAKKSVAFHCPTCGCNVVDLLPELKDNSNKEATESSKPKSRFQKEIEQLQKLQSLEHGEKAEGEETIETKKETVEDIDNDNDNEASEKEAETKLPPSPGAAPAKHDKEEPVLNDEKEVKEAPSENTGAKATPAPTPPEPPVIPPPVVQQPPAAEPQPVNIHQQQQLVVEQAGGAMSWMSDPVLHAIIIVLSVLCYMLFHKFQSLMEELRELNEALES